MYSPLQRLNGIFFFALSALLITALCISIQTYFTPINLQAATLSLSDIRVHKFTEQQKSRYNLASDQLSLKYRLDVDLQPIFTYNTKQIYLYIIAEHSSSDRPINKILIWDQILKNYASSKYSVRDGISEYTINDIQKELRTNNIKLSIGIELMPHVGVIQRYERDDIVNNTYYITLPDTYNVLKKSNK